MAEYKISLGVQLQTDDIISQINEAKRKVDPITIKVDAETKELTKSIQDALKTLSGGTKNALTLDTSKFEGSIADIKSAVVDLKKVLGSLDDSANMKSLLSSVNQIANAIGKVTDESETLAKSLSVLSKKDLSFNIGLDMGKKNNNMIAYGRAARKQVIPQLEAQIKELESIFGGQQATMSKLTAKGSKVGFDVFTDFADFNSDSAIKKMEAMEKYINSLKKLANIENIPLGQFEQKFSKNATELINDITGVEDAVEKAEDTMQKFKNIFGSGIEAEQLSAQLKPIVSDLTQIREAIQNLSKGVSLDGLTASFDRLSSAIENLLANAEKVKGVLNSGFDAGNVGGASTPSSTSAVKSAQQTGQKIGETVTKSAQQALNLDDVIDQQVLDLMQQYKIVGKKGSDAFNEIKQAVVEYRKELQLANSTNVVPKQVEKLVDDDHPAADFLNYDDDTPTPQRVISAITNNMRVPNEDKIENKETFQGLVDFVNGYKGKVHLPKSIYDEFADDFVSMRGQAAKIFTTGVGEDFENWINQINDPKSGAGIHIGLENGAEAAFKDIVNKLKKGRGTDQDNYLTGNQVFKAEYKYSDMEADVESAINNINQKELELAQTSNQTADAVSQNQSRIRQEYEQTQQEIANLNKAIQQSTDYIINPDKLDEDYGAMSTEDKQQMIEAFQHSVDNMEQRKSELESQANALKAQLDAEAQQAQEAANAVVQSEERKQQAYRETADAYEKISRDTSLTRDDAGFQKVFEESNQAAQEAQRHFQELLADEKAVVSVTEQFDDNNALQSFVVNIRRASGEVETLRYAMDKLNDEGDEGFVYQGSSASDSRVEKQLEARIKKANDLQIKLDKIKSGYKDANASKPIKDDDHIKALDVQYRKVEKAIIAVRNADDSTFSSMIANAEKEKAVLESMIREYRNAENVATSLRSKDISTVKDTYASKLDVLVSKMKSSGVYTDGFEKGAENLRSVLSDATDASGLVKFLNGLDKLEAGYKRADAAAREFNRSQKVGINTSGLESKISDLQRISPEIDKFETEIDGAKVSVKSLIDDLQQVKTQGDFSVVNARFKAFTDAAKAAGIAVTEVAQKAKSINDIKIKITDTGFNGFEQEVLRARNAAEELEGVYPDLESAIKRLDAAMEDVYSADQAGDVKRLVTANEEYEASLKQVYSQLKLYQQAEQKAYKAEMLNQKKSALSSEMETWLKENTRAARDFGEEIRRLQASLNGLDDKGVKLVGQQFKSITKQAQAMGKTGLTTFDRLKSKAKEYMSYLSAAEMFMYAEQAMRSMFEQVKLIDSAMTELKKVTDETDASYNQFLSNAASRSKELGTTIDGLVSSTADFARLGYGFEDAQGLAEVANVYAVVGDEIEGVEGATESLISTMAAFKDSAKGMSNSDFAMSIIDKFNEIGNNFAISSGGIGEALERSASSLMAANATLDESVALITASNQVVQDPVAVGTAWKTISMRMKSHCPQ